MLDDDAVLVGFGGCVAGLRLSATDYQRQRLDPTPPRSPAVPASALAALRLGRS